MPALERFCLEGRGPSSDVVEAALGRRENCHGEAGRGYPACAVLFVLFAKPAFGRLVSLGV